MKKRVLVVEDDRQILLTHSHILEKNGYQVATAVNGAEALSKLKESVRDGIPFQIVITDIYMPDINGLELIIMLNQERITVPVIAVTGMGDKDMVIELLRSGCRDYLEKPVAAGELVACVENVLREQEGLAALEMIEKQRQEKDRSRISVEMTAYKTSLDRLYRQLDSAADIYRQLVDISQKDFKINAAFQNRPLAAFGGDFIGMEKRGDVYDILLADVAGHDMGASFHTILIKAFFEENCRKANDGQTLFHLMNRQLTDHEQNERMITALFLRIDLESMRAEVVSAAHPPLIRINPASDMLRPVRTGGPVLGIYQEAEFTAKRFDIIPGERLFMHTDGLTSVSHLNTNTGCLEKLSSRGLDQLLLKHGPSSLQEMVAGVWADVLNFCNNQPDDDMLLLGLEIPHHQ